VLLVPDESKGGKGGKDLFSTQKIAQVLSVYKHVMGDSE